MGKTKDFSSDFGALLGGNEDSKPKTSIKEPSKPIKEVKTPVSKVKNEDVVKKSTKTTKSDDRFAPMPKRINVTENTQTRYSLADAANVDKGGRATKGRKKFTMMMRPDMRDMLNRIAINKRQSISDVIENVLRDYFKVD